MREFLEEALRCGGLGWKNYVEHESRMTRALSVPRGGPADQVISAGGKETAKAGSRCMPTREFLYVEDAAEGILLAAERYNGGQPVNPSR